MALNPLYDRLESFITGLQNSGRVRIPQSEFRFFDDAVPQGLVDKLGPQNLAPSVLDFYRQVDFIELRWTSSDDFDWKFADEDTDLVAGGLVAPNFTALADAIASSNGASLIDPHNALDADEHSALENYFPFDFRSGDYAVCFKRENGAIADQLHYVDPSGMGVAFTPLGVSVQKYLDVGFDQFFLNGWQRAMFGGDAKRREEIEFYVKQLGA